MSPDTRESLILRLRDRDDAQAWEEFVGIYRPVISRLGLARGLQYADAEDLTQQVLVSVAARVADWECDAQRASFRTWLARMVRNAAVNLLTRRRCDRGLGGTTAVILINGKPAEEATDEEIFDLEQRRELFRFASDDVRDEFQPATWDAFWLTAVEGLSAADVAEMTGRSIGSVYVARSRVMARLQQRVKMLLFAENEEIG